MSTGANIINNVLANGTQQHMTIMTKWSAFQECRIRRFNSQNQCSSQYYRTIEENHMIISVGAEKALKQNSTPFPDKITLQTNNG